MELSGTLEERCLAQSDRTASSVAWRTGSAFLLIFVVACLLQRIGPAWNSDINVEPDGPAHYVTGLMVRDYLHQGFPAAPLKFAELYYAHYPKVAIGHWPPVFYILQAVWMLIFGASIHSDLLLMAFLEALFACTLFELVRREFRSEMAAAGSAVLLLCIPIVQIYGSTILADLPVALFGFWAVLCWGRYLDTDRTGWAVAFSSFAALAILTKGNGYALVLVPPFTILLARRFELLKRPNLLLAGLPLALCLPWSLMTRRLIASTMQFHFGAAFFAKALGFFILETLKAPGYCVSAFALLGAIALLRRWPRQSAPGIWVSMLALVPAVILFHAIVPAGLEERYLIAVMPAMVLLAVNGASAMAEWFPLGPLPFARRARFWGAVMAIFFAVTTFSLPRAMPLGYADAARFLVNHAEFDKSIVLVSSENDGEGPFIARLAELDDPRPNRVVLRASRVLATSDWNGRDYHLRMHSPAELEDFLLATPVGVIVIDRSGKRIPNLHQPLLEAVIAAHPEKWRLACISASGDLKSHSHGIAVYRLVGSQTIPTHPIVLPPAGTMQRQLSFDPNKPERQH